MCQQPTPFYGVDCRSLILSAQEKSVKFLRRKEQLVIMNAEQIDMDAILNSYANQTARHFNAFGYVAVTPDEVKNVFSWQRDTQITFSYLKEWCEQNRTMDYRLKWRYVDDQPTALIHAAKVVNRMNWNRYYPYKTSGCAYCNFASKPDMMTCGSDKCMSIYRKEYVLMSLNL